MTEYGIRYDREGPLALITMDRPGRRNALDERMYDGLARVVADIRSHLPRVVILTGAGEKAFSAGFDVNPDNPLSASLLQGVERGDQRQIRAVISKIRRVSDELTMLPVPVIAAINGLAYGGGAEIAARCDLRVIDPEAVFCLSEVRLGLMPDHGGVLGITRLVGPSKAADLMLTARKVGAQEALTLGLVNRISAPGKALEEAKSLAQAIAENGPRAVRHALKVIRQIFDLPGAEALDLETDEAVTLIASGECIHGVAGFLSKRSPQFPEPD